MPNLQLLYNQLRNKQLFNTYKKQVYLWITPPGENRSYPMVLDKANITFNYQENTININVPREELGMFGIAPQFGSFMLPAKLTNFTIGTRCYQTRFLKLPWNRIAVNTTFLMETLEKIHNKPILGKIGEKLLKQLIGMTWEDCQKNDEHRKPHHTITGHDFNKRHGDAMG